MIENHRMTITTAPLQKSLTLKEWWWFISLVKIYELCLHCGSFMWIFHQDRLGIRSGQVRGVVFSGNKEKNKLHWNIYSKIIKGLNSDCQQFCEHQQNKQLPLTPNQLTPKIPWHVEENLGPDLGQAQKCGRVKSVNIFIIGIKQHL
jgi:hypothetical protein